MVVDGDWDELWRWWELLKLVEDVVFLRDASRAGGIVLKP